MSKSREIVRLHSEGLSQAEIARQLKCSPANVSITIKRHGVWDHTLRGMPLEKQKWLLERAKRLRMHPGDIAARMLCEIIDMYQSGDF